VKYGHYQPPERKGWFMWGGAFTWFNPVNSRDLSLHAETCRNIIVQGENPMHGVQRYTPVGA